MKNRSISWEYQLGIVAVLTVITFILMEVLVFAPNRWRIDPAFLSSGSNIQQEYWSESSLNRYLARQPLSLEKIDMSGLSAKVIFAFNPYYYRVAATKNIDLKVPIASLTKLTTVKTAMQFYKSDDLLTAKGSLSNLSVSAGLIAGDKIKFSEAIEAALVPSANDVAITIARSYSKGESEFINEMNRFASDLGMSSTRFSNASGLIDADNYSTAQDLQKIVMAVLDDPVLSKIVDDKTVSVVFTRGSKTVTRSFTTTNKLMLKNGSVKGVKTGSTSGAGQCLIAYFDWGGTNKLVTIVLNSPDRVGETERIARRVKALWGIE